MKKTKKQRMPVLIDRGLPCARREVAQERLWLAVAEAAQKGLITCPEAPTLDAALYGLACESAAAGIGIDNDTLASLALSEARLPAWKKN